MKNDWSIARVTRLKEALVVKPFQLVQVEFPTQRLVQELDNYNNILVSKLSIFLANCLYGLKST
jgi:hypothetical protein